MFRASEGHFVQGLRLGDSVVRSTRLNPFGKEIVLAPEKFVSHLCLVPIVYPKLNTSTGYGIFGTPSKWPATT